MTFLDPAHPFFRPAWRRWATTLIPLAWGAGEAWSGAWAWAAMFGGLGLYAGWVLIVTWRPPEA